MAEKKGRAEQEVEINLKVKLSSLATELCEGVHEGSVTKDELRIFIRDIVDGLADDNFAILVMKDTAETINTDC